MGNGLRPKECVSRVWDVRSASFVVVGVEFVHRLEELVPIDERSDEDQRAEDIPAPERAFAELVVDAAGLQFVADTSADTAVPHEIRDAERDGREEQNEKQIVHRFFTVVFRDEIDLFADVVKNHQVVDAESDETQEKVFRQTSVRFELSCSHISPPERIVFIIIKK